MRNYLPRTIGLAVSFPESSNSICVTFNVTIILTGLFSEILSLLFHNYAIVWSSVQFLTVTLRYNDMIFVRTS